MKSARRCLTPCFLLAAAAACGGSPVAPGAPDCLAGVFEPTSIAGTLAYVAYADSGTRLLEGVLTIAPQSNQHIAGTWTIGWAPGADTANANDVGPQLGTGDLIGAVQDTTVLVNLTPTFSDDNVELLACVTAAGFAGTWSHVGIAGEIAHGPFTATRRYHPTPPARRDAAR
jgi:hypothetical protein